MRKLTARLSPHRHTAGAELNKGFLITKLLKLFRSGISCFNAHIATSNISIQRVLLLLIKKHKMHMLILLLPIYYPIYWMSLRVVTKTKGTPKNHTAITPSTFAETYYRVASPITQHSK